MGHVEIRRQFRQVRPFSGNTTKLEHVNIYKMIRKDSSGRYPSQGFWVPVHQDLQSGGHGRVHGVR